MGYCVCFIKEERREEGRSRLRGWGGGGDENIVCFSSIPSETASYILSNAETVQFCPFQNK